HVQEWALHRLITLYPDQQATWERVFEAMLLYNSKGINYIIYEYLENNYSVIPGDLMLQYLDKVDDILMKSYILQAVINKGDIYSEEVYRQTIKLLNNMDTINDEREERAYYKLQHVLAFTKTEGAYQALKKFARSIPFEEHFLHASYSHLFEYKKPEDILFLFTKLFKNIKKVSEYNLDNIFISYSKLFKGEEFADYLLSSLIYEEDLDVIEDYLQTYWSANSGVMDLVNLLDKNTEYLYSKEVYPEVIHFITESLLGKIEERYPELSIFEEKGVDINSLLDKQEAMRDGDFWITLFLACLLNIENEITGKEKLKSIIHFLLSALIVFLENHKFEVMIEKAVEDREYLWEVFTLDRVNLPREINDLIVQQSSFFEDKLIALMKESKFSPCIERILDVVSELDNDRFIPALFNLIDDEQGEVTCDMVIKVLSNKTEKISLEMLERAINEGDASAKIYLSSLLEYYPCRQAAELIIEYWGDNIIDDYELFVMHLLKNGSKTGLNFLEKIAENRETVYSYEALIVLGIVNEVDEEIIKNYRSKLKKAKEDKIRKDNFWNYYKRKRQLDIDDKEYEENDAGTIIRKKEKVGRNDPCPCGSGKKYKKCCGR
ncbi:MAG TPA: SEC-C metal-binding domain-containing protein, partial [Halanaerobiales bacterium]|nr:SEC-C metal-binding domain-containing protein [Halanaerobiales bacterium]